MDIRTRYEDDLEAVNAAIEAKLSELHTAVPIKIVSVDRAKQTAVVQPLIKSVIRKADGTQEWVSMPEVHDAPLHFPQGGGVTMTFPVKEGDEGLMIVASRSQDIWQQSGGEQQQIDLRTHDLSNGFVLVGFKSNGNAAALTNVSGDSTEIRSTDGKTSISIKPGGGLTLTQDGVSMSMTSSGVDFTGGYVKHNGKNIGHDHIHGGITPGSSNTDIPAN